MRTLILAALVAALAACDKSPETPAGAATSPSSTATTPSGTGTSGTSLGSSTPSSVGTTGAVNRSGMQESDAGAGR